MNIPEPAGTYTVGRRKALQTDGDCISRQAAIDKFEPWLKVSGYSEGELNMLRAILYELRFLQGIWVTQDSRLNRNKPYTK